MDVVDIVENSHMRCDIVLVAEMDSLWHILRNPAAPPSDAVLPQEDVQCVDRQLVFGNTHNHEQSVDPIWRQVRHDWHLPRALRCVD